MIVEEAKKLISQAHSGAVNSSLIRDLITKENDVYAGILAEFGVLNFLNNISSNVYRPPVTDVKNQINIFVKNGIVFALYAFNKNISNSIHTSIF